jgi:hypothetical protein
MVIIYGNLRRKEWEDRDLNRPREKPVIREEEQAPEVVD